MGLWNLESVQARGEDLMAAVLQDLDRITRTVSQPVIWRWIMTRRQKDMSNVVDFSWFSGVSFKIIYPELI